MENLITRIATCLHLGETREQIFHRFVGSVAPSDLPGSSAVHTVTVENNYFAYSVENVYLAYSAALILNKD